MTSVDPANWNRLAHAPSPFLEHGFLLALERSDSIGVSAGWEPRYLIAERSSPEKGGSSPEILGAVAAFIKTHSYGEYIFDFAWANASEQGGLPYYPKLVVAAPATPATGSRLLLSPDLKDEDREEVSEALVAAVRELADAEGCSSIHWLFTTASEQQRLRALGFMPRASFQFHWKNEGYRSFDDFLARMNSRRRKQIRKERRRALAAVDEMRFVSGEHVSESQLVAMERFYQSTVRAHGSRAYLRPGFFSELCAMMGSRVQYLDVLREGDHVAGALFLETPQGLYGRYWGCDREIDCLHFEAAYYAGIERCIERGNPTLRGRRSGGAQAAARLHACRYLQRALDPARGPSQRRECLLG